MRLMFVVSCREAGEPLRQLAGACRRRGIDWGCFFTGAGVGVLLHEGMPEVLRCARKAIACERSWARFGGAGDCPVELGSQTDHSAMIAEAGKVVSL